MSLLPTYPPLSSMRTQPILAAQSIGKGSIGPGCRLVEVDMYTRSHGEGIGDM